MPPFSRAVSRTHDVLYRLCPQRGMLNFGLWDLRLVDPVADPHGDEAILRASGAAPLLRRAPVHGSMREAASDLHLVLATTARPRESRIPVYGPREAVGMACEAIGRGEKVGLLFGSEKNGLSNDELACAHAIVTIPDVLADSDDPELAALVPQTPASLTGGRHA